jgi:hypothetical protein
MGSIKLKSSKDQFIISVDKDSINKESLLQFIDNLRLESLAEKVDFDEDIEKLTEGIKEDWWKKNKDRFIPKND